MFKYITLFLTCITLALSAAFAGPGDKDLVISYHLPAKLKAHVYDVVKKGAPTAQPVNYHVTIGWVKDGCKSSGL